MAQCWMLGAHQSEELGDSRGWGGEAVALEKVEEHKVCETLLSPRAPQADPSLSLRRAEPGTGRLMEGKPTF